ncbi:MAG: metal ABC transporter permease [Planctomycetota bacterium]|jgi:zinc transport system permease protein
MGLIQDFDLYVELFGLSFLASLVVGLVLPLVGALMLLRREAFLGIAVPQFAAAGIAFGLLVLPWFPTMTAYFLDHGHPPMTYLLPFAAGAACLSLSLFGALSQGQRDRGAVLAGAFATASALSILFLSSAPAGSNLAETVMRGEVLLLDIHGLEVLAGVCIACLVFLILCRRALLVSAFDRDQAVALGLPVRLVGYLQLLLIGCTIGAGVMTVGPVLVFGLLFLPPLAARALARNIRGYLRWVSCLGLGSVLTAWPLSLELDLPYGPAAVTAAALWTLLAVGYARLRGRRRIQ